MHLRAPFWSILVLPFVACASSATSTQSTKTDAARDTALPDLREDAPILEASPETAVPPPFDPIPTGLRTPDACDEALAALVPAGCTEAPGFAWMKDDLGPPETLSLPVGRIFRLDAGALGCEKIVLATTTCGLRVASESTVATRRFAAGSVAARACVSVAGRAICVTPLTSPTFSFPIESSTSCSGASGSMGGTHDPVAGVVTISGGFDTGSACPRSLASTKTDVRYLSPSELEARRATVRGLRLAEWRYRWEAPSAPLHLGVVIDDAAQIPGAAPILSADRRSIDLYGYTSLAVGALQAQEAELATMRKELADLRKRLAALEAARATP